VADANPAPQAAHAAKTKGQLPSPSSKVGEGTIVSGHVKVAASTGTDAKARSSSLRSIWP